MIKTRLLSYLKAKGVNKSEFGRSIGVSSAYISSMRKSISPEKLELISKEYPDLNIAWLLTGEGEMLVADIPGYDSAIADDRISTLGTVPLIPIGAFAGEVMGFSAEGTPLAQCERVVAPVPGCDIAIDVSGDSMEPDFPNGCRVFCRRIYEESFIAWGNVFVLDTCNGAFIKRVFPSADNSVIEARSINPNYPSFNIPKASVFGMYRVLMMARSYAAS